jgi:hypothetical protein
LRRPPRDQLVLPTWLRRIRQLTAGVLGLAGITTAFLGFAVVDAAASGVADMFAAIEFIRSVSGTLKRSSPRIVDSILINVSLNSYRRGSHVVYYSRVA